MCSNQFTNNIKTYNILYCKFHMANWFSQNALVYII
jgi:hypothetical protein